MTREQSILTAVKQYLRFKLKGKFSREENAYVISYDNGDYVKFSMQEHSVIMISNSPGLALPYSLDIVSIFNDIQFHRVGNILKDGYYTFFIYAESDL